MMLCGCTTTFGDSKAEYKTQAKTGPSLEIPPDLTQLSRNPNASVPQGGAINASTLGQGAGAAVPSETKVLVAPDKIGDVSVIREGTNRWLKVARAPDAIWSDLRKFWLDNGFELIQDDAKLGIIETDWAENRAKIPKDWMRRTFSVIAALSSSNERDRFRTRLERSADGGTEIFVSHKGLVEEFKSASKDQLQWVARAREPELELEFMRRIMAALTGTTNAQAQQAVADKPSTAQQVPVAAPERASLLVQAAAPNMPASQSLLLPDAYEQAWRRVGLSLDRTNFTVDDRDRSKGVYFVRYALPIAEKDQPGFFSRMFGAKNKTSQLKYQILVKSKEDKSEVFVADASGSLVASNESLTMLKVLHADLK